MARKIEWFVKAPKDLYENTKFWDENNQSWVYSDKLINEIFSRLEALALRPTVSQQTSRYDVRNVIVDNFRIYFKYNKRSIKEMTIIDTRRNPKMASHYHQKELKQKK